MSPSFIRLAIYIKFLLNLDILMPVNIRQKMPPDNPWILELKEFNQGVTALIAISLRASFFFTSIKRELSGIISRDGLIIPSCIKLVTLLNQVLKVSALVASIPIGDSDKQLFAFRPTKILDKLVITFGRVEITF